MIGSTSVLEEEARRFFQTHFDGEDATAVAYAPGRVNLVGEHIDYHNLSVLPMALTRGMCVAFRTRSDRRVVAVSASAPGRVVDFGLAEIEGAEQSRGDWGNYVKAAALVARNSFGIEHGIEAAVVSSLPVAAGLSSSSALLVAFVQAFLAANGITATLADLMRVLPEGEQFVGTRGGGMDHAAILASKRGHALHIHFDPFSIAHVAIPEHWCFVVADSRHSAEKSAALVAEYNVRRRSGTEALRKLGFASFRQALASDTMPDPAYLTDADERNAFVHVMSESLRVQQAVAALRRADLHAFGQLMNDSHASLRDQLKVSTPTLDAMVEAATNAGAAGARITGAGFGGCMVALCSREALDSVRGTLKRKFYEGPNAAESDQALFVAEPADGSMHA